MATYIGFNTQYSDKMKTPQEQRGITTVTGSLNTPTPAGKKFRLTNEQLVLQDFINALNIPQGQKPGNPMYGTTLWGFIFEPNDLQTQNLLQEELQRMAELDPRIQLHSVNAYPTGNGILAEIQISINPFDNLFSIELMFDQETSTVYSQ